MFNDRKKITGIGSALVDLLLTEEETFVSSLGSQKGGMTRVDHQFIETALSRSAKPVHLVSGGSACNTVIGVGKLGGNAAFVGKLGDDDLGRVFADGLRESAVNPLLFPSSSPTGRVLSVITPDAQRTMFTCLGASTELDPAAINPELFADAAVVVVEGYLLFNPELMLATVKAAKAAGARISLDLSSFEVVHAARGMLDDIIRNYVDILIANEDEAEAFCGCRDEKKVMAHLLDRAPVAALKLGERGSCVSYNSQVFRIEAQTDRPPIDTTGAGDLWAAGFLFGLVNGYSIEACGAMGSACGYEVCQVVGAKIPEEGWDRIKKLISRF